MELKARAYDKDSSSFISDIQIDNPSNPYPTIWGYIRDPRFEVNLCSNIPDKEGTLIHEGDIIEFDEKWSSMAGTNRKTVLVTFINGCFMVNSGYIAEEGDTLLFPNASHCRIVGDKYHNYDLVDSYIYAKHKRKKHKVKKK